MKDRSDNWHVRRHSAKIGPLLSAMAWIGLDPLRSLFTHALPSDGWVFTTLWSSHSCEPSGYLNIAWSQSRVNQISSDLPGPADKTLHGRRKRQTAGGGTKGPSMKNRWSETDPRLFKLTQAANNQNILLVSFLLFQFTLALSDLDLGGKCLSFHLEIPIRCNLTRSRS